MKPISNEQYDYLQKEKKQRRIIQCLRFSLLLFFLLIWETASRLSWIDSYVFSSPCHIIQCFFAMTQNASIFHHIGITLLETLLSFLFVLLISLVLAAILWTCKPLSQILDPYMVVLNSLPKSALAPLLIVWLGTGLTTIIITGMSVAIFGSVLSLCTSFNQTDPEKEKLIFSLGGKKIDVFFLLILPANTITILNLMKVNIGLCLVGVIIGEFISSRQGLGYLIIYGSQVFKLSWVILSIVILCIIAMILYKLIDEIEKWYLKRIT